MRGGCYGFPVIFWRSFTDTYEGHRIGKVIIVVGVSRDRYAACSRLVSTVSWPFAIRCNFPFRGFPFSMRISENTLHQTE